MVRKRKEYERNTFVSRKDNIVVYRIREKSGSCFNAEATLGLHDIEDAKHHTDNLAEYLPENPITVAGDEFICFAAQNEDNTDFGAVARIIAHDGNITADNDKYRINNTRELLIILKTFVKGERDARTNLIKKELCEPEEADIVNHSTAQILDKQY